MSEHAPVAWYVARWSEDPWSRGSWTFIRPGGSPLDRATLGQPISERVILAGEAVHAEQAGMVHAAWETGRHAARWCITAGSPNERVAVIGAGMAGLGTARTLADGGREVHLGMGRVEKVLMRFETRWWPASPSGYLRWYDREPSWGEWLDLTDGCGEPVVAGLIAGPAIDRWHRGRSDEEVVAPASDALAGWAAAVRRGPG